MVSSDSALAPLFESRGPAVIRCQGCGKVIKNGLYQDMDFLGLRIQIQALCDGCEKAYKTAIRAYHGKSMPSLTEKGRPELF